MEQDSLSDDRPLILAAGAGAALGSAGEVHCLVRGQLTALEGVDPDVLRALLAQIDGSKSAAQVVQALGADAAAQARELLRALLEVGLVEPRVEAEGRDERVLLLGNHGLGRAVDRALASAGFRQRSSVRIERFAGVEAERGRALTPAPRLEPMAAERELESASVAELAALFREFDRVVCAVEAEPYRALLDVNRAALEAGKPCLFVMPDFVGPYVEGGAGPCFECWFQATFGALGSAPFLPSPHGADAARLDAVAELAVRRLLAPDFSASVVRLDAAVQRIEPLLAHEACTACHAGADEPVRSALASSVEIARLWPEPLDARATASADAYRSVGIVGGGTAGYLTALGLKRFRPELEVTLIESSSIPVIGVGEATTPELVKMLHAPRFLGRDIVDFYRRVKPTWKLGIKFQFGPRDFTFPFQRGRLLESKLYDGHLQNQSLGAMLMATDRSPVIRDENGRVSSLAYLVRGAYHLENRRFVRYLEEEAESAGVRHLDAKIAEVRRSDDGESVAELVTDDGRRLSFDLYVDCSGFRSILMQGALGSRFIDWSSTLFTDRAVVATVPHDGTVKPYTLAETMDAGWCWNIPFEEEDHRGYVFASNALDADRAEAEMRAANPGMGAASLVKFRSGRHEHFWKGNTVAIGNSYGFVEPLESTAIHMVVLTIELLGKNFPSSRQDRVIPETLNRKVSERWDALRWFLGIHYRFNRRRNTPFWRAANAEVDISGAEERVSLFRERAPLSYRTSLFYTLIPPEFFSDDHSYDTLLMGLDVPAKYLEPVEDSPSWQRRRSSLLRTAGAALPQAEALEWLREHPEEQGRVTSEPESWIHRYVPA